MIEVSPPLAAPPSRPPPRRLEAAKHARQRRRRIRRLRKLFAAALFVLPLAFSVFADRMRRGASLEALGRGDLLRYAATYLLGFCLFSCLLIAASRKRGRLRIAGAILFLTLATLSWGGQTYFFEHYNSYLGFEPAVFTKDFWGTVILHHLADPGGHLRALLPPLLASIGLMLAGRRLLRPRRAPATFLFALVIPLLVLVHFIPKSSSSVPPVSPEILYLQATEGMVQTQLGLGEHAEKNRPRVRSPLELPPLAPMTSPPRNVLLVLLESTRADAVCIAHDPHCEWTPHTNALLPKRFPLTQMRALDSTTVISSIVLWTGLGPEEERDTIFSAPWLFDYAKAAGYDTAYWTSQDVLFGNLYLLRHRLGASSYLTARHIDPALASSEIGAPEKDLAERVIVEMGKLHEPFFAVLHLSNTHFPYYSDPSLPRPFQPTSVYPNESAGFRRHYQNAIYQSDMHLARVLRALRESDAGKRTAIVYTSDHGEALGERGHGGHIFSLYDEEIHVPAWLDAPSGLLTPDEEKNLAEKRDELVFHIDMTPTILDLMGLWESPALSTMKARMPGQSLLRPLSLRKPILMTNCSPTWTCWRENWGIMKGSRKLFARAWDHDFHCYDVAEDPGEIADLGADACKDLADLTLAHFGRMPGKGP